MPNNVRQLSSREFPPLLHEISDPPAKLFLRGKLPADDAKYLCVVGSRKATPYGRDVCASLIEGLTGHNIIIVSGLALGIDALAHLSALEAGLTTVAVPGSGLGEDVLYPRTNVPLARRILESGGALISEFPEDYRARPESFPQRNRIMAGLSHAVLIVEAETPSGTLITARLASEYNRDVLAVPGSIFSSSSSGPHSLIRLGAVPVRKSSDILEALGIDIQRKNTVPDYGSLSKEERELVEILSEPLSRDELIAKVGLPASRVNALLSSMELKKVLVEKMGTIRRNI